jgi:ABC-type nitrate/sulfonate/bicarbonate transport system substrate-binding protein
MTQPVSPLRRTFLAGIGASLLPLPAIAASKKVSATIAMVTTSQGNGSQFLYMKRERLFEKYAAGFGYELETRYLNFQTGPQITEGMVKGDIDFGIAGYLPMATIMASGLPILPISNIEGSAHWVMVRPGSPIRNVEDLVKQKAKIATAVGSTSQYVLLELFRVYFGKSPEELGVTVIHMPPPDGITFPQGIDAILYWEALPSIAEEKVGAVRLVNEYGHTGPAYEGGAGQNLFTKQPQIWGKSLYAPESLVAYRVFATTRKAFAEKNPQLVTAFLLAQQEAVKVLHKDFKLAYELNKEAWPLPFNKVAAFLRLNVVFGRRDWIWITESDLKPTVWGSYWGYDKKLLRQPVTWDIAESYLKPTVAQVMESYKRVKYPDLAEIRRPAKPDDKPVPDLRGDPVWMMDKWTKPLPAVLSRYVTK